MVVISTISDRNETLWKWKRKYVQFSESILHGCIDDNTCSSGTNSEVFFEQVKIFNDEDFDCSNEFNAEDTVEYSSCTEALEACQELTDCIGVTSTNHVIKANIDFMLIKQFVPILQSCPNFTMIIWLHIFCQIFMKFNLYHQINILCFFYNRHSPGPQHIHHTLSFSLSNSFVISLA